jgi:hypothetical protein
VTNCASKILRFSLGLGGVGALALVAAVGATACIDGQVGRGARTGERSSEPGATSVLIPSLTVDPCEQANGQAVDAAGAVVDAAAGGQGQGEQGQAGGGAGAVAFPALLDLRFFQLDVAGAGGPGNSGAIFTLVNAVAKNAVDDLQRFIDISQVTLDVDAQGRQVERRTAPGFESRQTFDKGIQYGVAFLGGKKKLQFTRNHNTGAFEGIIVAPGFDNNAPLAAFVTPAADGTAVHLIVEDIGNNLKNDYRGELVVDARKLTPIVFKFFQQFNGGLAAQPESAALVKTFDFGGIAGF